MSALPQPFVPPDCDLRGLSYMPLDAQRLRDSDLFVISSGDEFKAAVTLWCVSWGQVPAASLPDEDKLLAHFAHVDQKTWRKIKGVALRGWVKCSDGRLYHPIVAEKACEAWADRLKFREKREKDAKRLQAWRDGQKHVPERRGNGDENGSETQDETRFVTVTATRDETLPEEEGTRSEVEGIGGGGSAREADADDWPAGDACKALVAEVGSPWLDPAKSPGLITTAGRLAAWRRDGASWVHDVLPVVSGLCAAAKSPISAWKYFDPAMGRSIAESRRALEIPAAGTVVPLRTGSPLANQIDAEKAEAKRRALAAMEAANG